MADYNPSDSTGKLIDKLKFTLKYYCFKCGYSQDIPGVCPNKNCFNPNGFKELPYGISSEKGFQWDNELSLEYLDINTGKPVNNLDLINQLGISIDKIRKLGDDYFRYVYETELQFGKIKSDNNEYANETITPLNKVLNEINGAQSSLKEREKLSVKNNEQAIINLKAQIESFQKRFKILQIEKNTGLELVGNSSLNVLQIIAEIRKIKLKMPENIIPEFHVEYNKNRFNNPIDALLLIDNSSNESDFWDQINDIFIDIYNPDFKRQIEENFNTFSKIYEIERKVGQENWTNKDVEDINAYISKLPDGSLLTKVIGIRKDMKTIMKQWENDNSKYDQYADVSGNSPEEFYGNKQIDDQYWEKQHEEQLEELKDSFTPEKCVSKYPLTNGQKQYMDLCQLPEDMSDVISKLTVKDFAIEIRKKINKSVTNGTDPSRWMKENAKRILRTANIKVIKYDENKGKYWLKNEELFHFTVKKQGRTKKSTV